MIGFMRLLFCFLFFIISAVTVYSDEIDGKVLLKKGKEALKRGNYEEAKTSLSGAEKEIPLLGDYALLWLSDAHRKIGDHKESLKTIRALMKKYPRSPLIKEARSGEIEEAEAISEENMQRLYKAFIKDYPKDMEMKYLYASWLKRTGDQDKARSIFKDIYIAAGPFSQKASRELSPADIGVKDLKKRASNLMKAYNFKKAESVFREALAKDDRQFEREILNGLGLSLFRQKKYSKAADVYEKAHSTYWQVRSLYRAGEGEAFNAAFEKLKRSGSRMTGRVLIWLARDYRREGDIEKALKTFQTVKEQYPSETEDALWGIGWTYFRAGYYKKAADTFTKLYKTYHDTQYLYWKARSLAEDGQDASKVYAKLVKKDRDFYSILAYLQIENTNDQSSTIKTKDFLRRTSTRVKTPMKPSPNERVEALLDLDFLDEASHELKYISENAHSFGDILYICLKYQELEQYKNLVRLATKLPDREEFYQFRYPRAYQDIVEDISVKYKVDPFLMFSVAREESRFDPHAKSIAGALGIMQIMPQTAKRLDRRLRLGASRTYEILDIEKNLHLGIYLMSKNIREFGSYSQALAAYNAGEHQVRNWLRQGRYESADEFIEDIPYRETRKYVKRVLTSYFEYNRLFSQKDNVLEISFEKL
jgi:soluble lytic murein transglycosylase